jgi:hypothetical protein
MRNLNCSKLTLYAALILGVWKPTTVVVYGQPPGPKSLPAPAAARMDFVTHIAPILQTHCLTCRRRAT